MKRIIISLFLIFATWQATFAMSYERAREEALYLTDKMAYELNLNDQQYNDAYEINLDYFLSLNSEADLYEDYLSYRLSDFRHILYDWQYNLMLAADYFIRPVYWRAGGWFFPIYSHYTIGHFYYSYPTVYYSYHGGHGRVHYHCGFYASRRPVWNGGLRGHQPVGGHPNRGSLSYERRDRVNGNGYHRDIHDRSSERTGRGNSFGNSSSRNPRNDYSRRDGNSDRPGNYGSGDHNRQGNPNMGNRNNAGYRNHGSTNRSINGSGTYGSHGNNSTPRISGSNGGFSSHGNSGISNRNFGSPHSSGSRGGSFGGSSRGSSGGSLSRGGRR